MFNPEEFSSEEEEELEESDVEKEKNLEEEQKPHFDAVILFGGGLRDLEEEFPEFSKKQSEEFATNISEELTEDKRKWAKQARVVPSISTKMRALGCLEMLKSGDVDEVLVTGGRVKSNRPSEAELMRDYMSYKYQTEMKRKVEEGEITKEEATEKLRRMVGKLKLEDRAMNTVENFAHVINMMDESKKEYDNVAFLSNRFHISRIGQLGEKFGMEAEKVEAEEGLVKRSRHYDRFLKKALDQENPVYDDMLKSETRWSRGLNEVPLYFLPQAVMVNKERLKEMYKAEKEEIDKALKKKGLTWEEFLSLPNEERAKLRELPPEEWKE